MTPTTASIAEVKRFIELWTSGARFAQALRDDPQETLARYRLGRLDVEELRPLYDPTLAGKDVPVSPLVQAYRDHIQMKLKYRDQVRRECVPENERFRQWHERQVARCRVELGPAMDAVIIHTPVAVELALGCSVGCWYCSVDAPPLKEVFPYTDDNGVLWRDMLATLKQVGGDAMKWGVVYWASEPMDNPDFEHFCDDFHNILGMYPQTTTAAAMRDPQRTAALLVESQKKGCLVNRFSVNSLSVLDRILDTFTADQLASTELIFQNNEAEHNFKAEAGRSIRHFKKRPNALLRERQKMQKAMDKQAAACGTETTSADEVPMPGTTSCMTGFLINMVEKRVRLISPCYANERWPLGYMVFDEGFFTDTESFRQLVGRMIEEKMTVDLPEDRPLKLAPFLKCSEIEEGFALSSPYQRSDCKIPHAVEYIRQIGKLLAEGTHSAGAISILCNFQFGAADALTRGLLTDFYRKGMLDEGL